MPPKYVRKRKACEDEDGDASKVAELADQDDQDPLSGLTLQANNLSEESIVDRKEPFLQDITVKQEKCGLDDKVRSRGRNWTDREIRVLVQAGLGVNLDSRTGSDNKLR